MEDPKAILDSRSTAGIAVSLFTPRCIATRRIAARRIAPVLYSAGLLQRTMKDPFDLAVDTAKFVRRPFLDGLHRLCIYT